jgi:hypothetical protein
MSFKRITLLLVAVLASGGIAAGCGGDEETQGASGGSTAQKQSPAMGGQDAAAPTTDTAAADLRAGLTAQLQEHVYLAGTAIAKGVGEGLDSKTFTAAAGTLDKNSMALSESIGSVYGADAGEQFLALWRRHIGFFVDYTKGKATGDMKAVKQAEQDLDGYREEFGAFLAGANPELTKEAVADELKPHVTSVFATIDSVVANDGQAYMKLREAASHMPTTANVLAGAIARQKKLDGDTDAPASALRAGLTAQLQEHVYLAGLTVDAGVGAGLDSKTFEAAAGTLDENSKALSESIGSVYGADAGEQFLALWRRHIGFFVDYTKGKATGDKKMVKQAEQDLDGYREEFGAFLASANPELTKKAVADELKPHVSSVFKAIDASVAGKPAVFDRLREAASHMPQTADVLAGAIVAQMPEKFQK